MVSKWFIPLIGGLIGLSTNWIAIKLLFRPLNPIFGIQGILPRRKKQIAENLSKAVKYLLPLEDLAKKLSPMMKEVQEALIEIIWKELPWVTKMFSKGVKEQIQEFFKTLTKPDNFKNLLEAVTDEADIQGLVKKKIEETDFLELERMVYRVSLTELRFILFAGFFIGLCIGGLQVLLWS